MDHTVSGRVRLSSLRESARCEQNLLQKISPKRHNTLPPRLRKLDNKTAKDDELYMAAAAAVVERESLLEKITDRSVLKTREPQSLQGLRVATLRAVEAIVDWRQGNAFMWEGQNYLVRLAHAEDTEHLLTDGTIPTRRNPFILDVDIDTLANEDDTWETTADQLWRMRFRRAARAILAEERTIASWNEKAAAMHRLSLTESEVKRLTPPRIDPLDLETLAAQACPRLPTVATLACLQVLLHPEIVQTPGRGLPSIERLCTRPLRYTLLKFPRRIATKLETFDAAVPTPRHILKLLWPLLATDRYTVDDVRDCSSTVAKLHEWLQALVVVHSSHLPCGAAEPSRAQTNRRHVRGEELLSPKTVDIYTKGSRHYREAENRVADTMRSIELFEDDDDLSSVEDDNEVKADANFSRDKDSRTKSNIEGLRHDLAALKSEMLALRAIGHGGENAQFPDVDRTLIYSDMSFNLQVDTVYLSVFAVVMRPAVTIPACTLPLRKSPSLMDQHLSFSATTSTGHEMLPRAIPAIHVDRITGFMPSELAAMKSDQDRIIALKPLLTCLQMIVSDDNSPHQLALFATLETTCLYSSRRVVDGICLDVKSSIINNDNDVTVAEHGRDLESEHMTMQFWVNPVVGGAQCDPVDDSVSADGSTKRLVLGTESLELSIMHRPELYQHAHLRWKRLCELACAVATRLTFREERATLLHKLPARDVALDCRVLDLDRRIPLPSQFCTSEGAKFELHLSPNYDGIDILLICDDPNDPATNGGLMDSLSLTSVERQAFASEQLVDEATESPFALLRRRISVKWDETIEQRSGSNSMVMHATRSNPPTSGRLRLHLDRIVYQEVRRISGKSTTLRALVTGNDLTFQASIVATSACSLSNDESPSQKLLGSSLIDTMGLNVSKVVPLSEMQLLVSSEPLDHQRRMLYPINRRALARYLASKLKLVEHPKQSDCSETSSSQSTSYELETTLVSETRTIPVGVNGTNKEALIGSVKIDDHTTLEQVRRLIAIELDDEDVPSGSYRFLYQRAPCSRRQEAYRLAVDCLPVIVILTLNPLEHENATWTSHWRETDDREGTTAKKKKKARKRKKSSIFSRMRGAFRTEQEQTQAPATITSMPASQEPTRPNEATPPSSLPLLVDSDARATLRTVAIPLGTTATVCQGNSVIEIDDEVSHLDLDSMDILRFGNQNGGDFKLADIRRGGDARTIVVLEEPYSHEHATSSRNKLLDIPQNPLKNCVKTSRKVEDDYDSSTLLLIDPEEEARMKMELETPPPPLPDGARLQGLVVYKLLPKALDRRPLWRIEFDNGLAEYHMGDFAYSRKQTVNFGVFDRYSRLEQLVVDAQTYAGRIHMQRIQFFELVSVDHIVDELFKLLCSWYPVSAEGVDGAKWAKLVRDNALIPDVINPAVAAQIDIAFKRQLTSSNDDGKEIAKNGRVKQQQKGVGRLDRKQLKQALIELAYVKYPKKTTDVPSAPASVESPMRSPLKNETKDNEASLSNDTETSSNERNQVLRHLLFDKIVMIPEINRRAWYEAKLLAMLMEGKQQCASTRIQATLRRNWQFKLYRSLVSASTRIEASIRQCLSRNQYCLRRTMMESNYILRCRWSAAFTVQHFWRTYSYRRNYLEKVRSKREEYRRQLAEQRSAHRQRTDVVRQSTVFRRVKFVSGWLVKTRIRRLNTSRSTTDFGLRIEVYMPRTQQTHTFKVTDEEVRASLELILGVDGISGTEILEPRALSRIADRLLVRVVNKRPIVIFTRRGHSERGMQVLRRGFVISGEAYVLTAFRSDDEVVFHAYSTKSCETLRTSVSTKYLEEWIMVDHNERIEARAAEERRQVAEAKKLIKLSKSGVIVDADELEWAERRIHEFEEANQASMAAEKTLDTVTQPIESDKLSLDTEENEESAPVIKKREGPLTLLDNENLPQLLKWLMAKVHVIWYQRHGRRERRKRLVFEYELDEVKMEKAALVVQGMWKMRRSLKLIREMVRANWEKRYDASSGTHYYVDLRTEEAHWTKPKLLGSQDLELAPDEWRAQTDEYGSSYYMNPATGQTSWLSVDEAARMVERAYRRRQAADFGQPSFEDMVRALRMQRQVEDKYAAAPDRLSSRVNYALLLHTQRFELDAARKLYKGAMELAPENPILLRAYGIFMLMTLESPRQAVFQRTLDMFKNAELRDPGRVKFKLTEDTMFHWAVVAQREHPMALLNYALLLQTIIGDYDRAERFYHRALGALSEHDDARSMCVENFEFFEVERLPGGKYSSGNPSTAVLRNSSVAETPRPEWGEYQLMVHENPAKPKASFHFWLNTLTSRGTWQQPDWSAEIQKRIDRSEFVREKQGCWCEYYDHRLECTFYHNVAENKISATDPFQVLQNV